MTNSELAALAARHRGNLAGRLTDVHIPARVTIALTGEVAHQATAQHLLWMLANLLARQAVEIQEIQLDVPPGVPVAAALSPFFAPDSNGSTTQQHMGDLLECVRSGISALHPEALAIAALGSSLASPRTTVFVRIGPGPLFPADQVLVTTAMGWCGYIGQTPTSVLGDDGNPIGAYVASALCAGEIFKFVRAMRSDTGNYAHALWLDAYRLRITTQQPRAGIVLPAVTHVPDAVLVGVGAVGAALLHTLYALDHGHRGQIRGTMVIIDGDPRGIERTNLNRYMLFQRSDVGKPKAATAAAAFAGRALSVVPKDCSWQTWWNERCDRVADPTIPLVLSAVDTNLARHAIQDAYPTLTFGAATNNMRAQLNRYAPERSGPCLRCHNLLERRQADEDIIARLQSLPSAERHALARHHQVQPDALEAYLRDPHGQCGRLSGEALQRFATALEEPAWSVGFVSLLAGVLLGASYLRLGLRGHQAALSEQHNQFQFQFWRPAATLFNRLTTLPPQATCRCQQTAYPS